MTRRGQFEMVGLVFVVLILVVGFMIYLQFSNRQTGSSVRDAKEALGSATYLTALKETTVPDCGVSFARLAQGCVENEGICGNDCAALQDAMTKIADKTLEEEGRKYNLSVEGTSVTKMSDCKSGDPKVQTTSGYGEPITLHSGTTRLVLYYCK